MTVLGTITAPLPTAFAASPASAMKLRPPRSLCAGPSLVASALGAGLGAKGPGEIVSLPSLLGTPAEMIASTSALDGEKRRVGLLDGLLLRTGLRDRTGLGRRGERLGLRRE